MQNLRIVVLLDSRNPALQQFLSHNPALLATCTTLFWDALAQDQEAAVVQTAHQQSSASSESSASQATAPSDKQLPAKLCAWLRAAHAAAAQHKHVAPQHFRGAANQACTIMAHKQRALQDQIDFLQVRDSLQHCQQGAA